MNEEFEQNELVNTTREMADNILEGWRLLGEMNQCIEDKEKSSCGLVLLVQHRHEFEEQGVADHHKCLKMMGIIGDSTSEVAHQLALAMHSDETMTEIVKAALAKYIHFKLFGIGE